MEYDIAAQAKAQAGVVNELERILLGRFLVSSKKGYQPFAGLPPAPHIYWRVFEWGEPVVQEAGPVRQGASEVLPEIEWRIYEPKYLSDRPLTEAELEYGRQLAAELGL